MSRLDSEVKQSVLRELEWDTRVDETEVGVAVEDGIVTLSGTVSSWATRMAAAEAAHRVHGVLDVANDLQVKLPGTGTRSDTDLAHAVRHALQWDVFVPDTHIQTTVSNGAVVLEGEVDYGNQRVDAEKAIRDLVGVTRVQNNIVVRPHPDGHDVLRAIESALERRAKLEAGQVHVEVADGCARLSGRVHSWSAWTVVHNAARATPGVRSVDDQIQIDPHVD